MAKTRSRKPKPARVRARPRSAPKLPPLAPLEDETKAFEEALRAAGDQPFYVLRLFVTGSTARSTTAVTNIRRLCDQHLKGRYDLEVIDIYQQPVLARGEQIIAAPTLVKMLPSPLRKMVGDLSNEAQVLFGLDIKPGAPKDAPRTGDA